MTFEELKVEAERMGYRLVEIQKPLGKMEKCPLCGKYPKVRRAFGAEEDWYVYCYRHLEGPHVNTSAYYINPHTGNKIFYRTDTKHDLERMARDAWNEMILNYGKEVDNEND